MQSRGARHSAPSARAQAQSSHVLFPRTANSSHIASPEPLGNSFFRKHKSPKGKRLVFVRELVTRLSSIHTRLGFMQRRLVKIEIISDTI